MSKKASRFSKLEVTSNIKIFKRQKDPSKRFLCLEVDGHKIKLELAKDPGSKNIFCPRCGYPNPKDSPHCSLCLAVIKHDVQETVSKEKLESWQRKCPGCGATCNATQKYCFRCGWRIAYWSEEEKSPARTAGESVSKRYKNEIKLTIDGYSYSSNDVYIPAHIRELMDKIDKEGYSKELVDNWVKERNLRQGVENDSRRESLEATTAALRWGVVWRLIALVASLAIPVIFIWLRIFARY